MIKPRGMSRKRIFQILGPVLFILIQFIPFKDLSIEGRAVLASTAWVALWWITEAVELEFTSLMPIILLPLSGGLPIKETTSAYGHPFIFLFMGGFIIGLAIEKWQLHRRIAFGIIRFVGSGEKRIILGFMLATAFLSMWISNTATAVMMLPIGVSVVNIYQNREQFALNLMLGIGYSASIGGMATLIGTPPNIIFAGVVKDSLNEEISFLRWMLFALPFVVVLLFICWFYLTRNLQKGKSGMEIPDKPGSITIPEKRVLVVFVLIAFFWMTRSLIWN
jgi:sodium-dependent dicarboxylate transporter 2/3/5